MRLHFRNFNPLAPCGARHSSRYLGLNSLVFQSTCSVRSKTRKARRRAILFFISIHLLRAEQDLLNSTGDARYGISIHLLRAEQDAWSPAVYPDAWKISIHLLRAEQDPIPPPCRLSNFISIHLLRAEQDWRAGRRQRLQRDFNPLAPCGARRAVR